MWAGLAVLKPGVAVRSCRRGQVTDVSAVLRSPEAGQRGGARDRVPCGTARSPCGACGAVRSPATGGQWEMPRTPCDGSAPPPPCSGASLSSPSPSPAPLNNSAPLAAGGGAPRQPPPPPFGQSEIVSSAPVSLDQTLSPASLRTQHHRRGGGGGGWTPP